jgi:hypothetical protein
MLRQRLIPSIAMTSSDLVSIIKAKQAQMAKLQAELEEAQAQLGAVADGPAPAHRAIRRHHARRRSSRMLEHSPTAREAATIIRAAGKPLHATAIATIMKRRGHAVLLATLVSTLSRWVQSRAVFYRAGRNVFGLIGLRRRPRA